MKKLFNILVLFSLLLVLDVKADMGPPSLPDLDAIVKKDGAKCIDTSNEETIITFKKGDVINVSYIYDDQYGYYDESKDKTCYISSSDLEFGKKEYKLKRENRLEDEITLMIVHNDGVEMYEGPHTSYAKKNINIPKGTILKTRYAVGTYWYYVSYNNVEGYISSEDNTIVTKTDEVKETTFYTSRDISISDLGYLITEEKNKNNKEIGVIPANTEFTALLWRTDYTWNYYLTYNDITGFVYARRENDFTATKGGKLKALSKINVYKDLNFVDEENGKGTIVGTLEANKEYEVSYYSSEYSVYIFYIPSMNGWINCYYDYDNNKQVGDFVFTNKDGEKYDTREEHKRYILESIKITGYDIDFKKDVYTYNVKINNNDTKLDFVVNDQDNINVDILNNYDLVDGSKITVRVSDDEGVNTYTFNIIKDKLVEPTKDDTKDSNNVILWLCIGGGILFALTVAVIIILANKKNKKEKNKDEEVIKRLREIANGEKRVEDNIEENANETEH